MTSTESQNSVLGTERYSLVWYSACLGSPGFSSPVPHKLGVVAHACNPSAWEVEAEELKFKVILLP